MATPTIKLASTITKQTVIGQFLLTPGTVYDGGNTTTSIPLDHFEVCSALARGIIVFADTTDVTVYLADPAVRASAMRGNRFRGFFPVLATSWNVYGVA